MQIFGTTIFNQRVRGKSSSDNAPNDDLSFQRTCIEDLAKRHESYNMTQASDVHRVMHVEKITQIASINVECVVGKTRPRDIQTRAETNPAHRALKYSQEPP